MNGPGAPAPSTIPSGLNPASPLAAELRANGAIAAGARPASALLDATNGLLPSQIGQQIGQQAGQQIGSPSTAPRTLGEPPLARAFGAAEWSNSLVSTALPGARLPNADEAWLRGVNASLAEALRPLTMAQAQRAAAVLPDGGQLTQSSISSGAASAAATAAAAGAAQLHALGAHAARDSVAVPTQINPLQTEPMRFGPLLDVDEEDDAAACGWRASWIEDNDDEAGGGDKYEDEDEHEGELADDLDPLLDETAAVPLAAVGVGSLSADSAPAYGHLTAALAGAGQHAALRELELGRRVLLLMPSRGEPTHARVHLLGLDRSAVGQVQSFSARWSPAGLDGRADGWRHWRVHQEMSRGRWPVLQSSPSARSGGDPACMLRLGAQPATLHDVRTACLDIPDGSRFLRTLGSQWSLLMVLAAEPA